MAAHVESDFDNNPFRLDEEGARKLWETIERRVKDVADVDLRLKVYRGDDFAYETSSVDDLVSEENADWKAVTRVDYLASNDDEQFKFALRFRTNNGVEMRPQARTETRSFCCSRISVSSSTTRYS